jgi:hypothetical protein
VPHIAGTVGHLCRPIANNAAFCEQHHGSLASHRTTDDSRKPNGERCRPAHPPGQCPGARKRMPFWPPPRKQRGCCAPGFVSCWRTGGTSHPSSVGWCTGIYAGCSMADDAWTRLVRPARRPRPLSALYLDGSRCADGLCHGMAPRRTAPHRIGPGPALAGVLGGGRGLGHPLQAED